MKIVYFSLCILIVVNALSDEEKWNKFKKDFGRKYKSLSEEVHRFRIFRKTLKIIEEHNDKYEAGESTYFLGINNFADMEKEEFSELLKNEQKFKPPVLNMYEEDFEDIPEAFDWRDQNINAVLDVRRQGNCVKSSWAYSAVGALEGQNAILNKHSDLLSAQQLIDCSDNYGNDGCEKGSPISAFQYVQFNSIEMENSYPTTYTRGVCNASGNSVLNVTGYRSIRRTEDDLKSAVYTVGPISVNIYSSPIMYYAGGVFQNQDCISDFDFLDYSALVVGYGTQAAIDNEPAIDFWSIKMSMDVSYGEDGYLRIARGWNQCGIALDASYPVVIPSSY